MRYFILISSCALLTACGDPMADVPRLSQVEVASDTPTLEAISVQDDTGQDGLFARLLSGKTEKPTQDPEIPAAETEGANINAEDLDQEQSQSAVASTAPLGAETPVPVRRQGLLAKLSAPRFIQDEATSDIAPGTVLPYGQIARVCHLPKKQMGTKVAQYPERNPRHKLFDSAPSNTGPRNFYLTGFGDGCVRQFTASLAVFGSAGMHEQLRYGLPAQVQPYSDTDKAYEKLKSGICRVPRKKPCGAKVARLERDTVFLTIYERYGGNSRWDNLLLHAGKVVAKDSKGI